MKRFKNMRLYEARSIYPLPLLSHYCNDLRSDFARAKDDGAAIAIAGGYNKKRSLCIQGSDCTELGKERRKWEAGRRAGGQAAGGRIAFDFTREATIC